MSYDPKVFELGWDFILAGKFISEQTVTFCQFRQPADRSTNCLKKCFFFSNFFSPGESYRVLDMEKVPFEDQYEMCGLFKQSTFGDIEFKIAGSQGHVLRNLQAWQANKGLSKLEAIRKYVTKADQLVEAYKSA